MLLFFSWKVQIAVKHFNFNRSKAKSGCKENQPYF